MYRVFVYFKNLYLKMKNTLKVNDDNSDILWGERRLKGYTLNDGEVNYKAQLTPQEYFEKHYQENFNEPIRFLPRHPEYNPYQPKYNPNMGVFKHLGKERTQNELTLKDGNYFDYPSSVTHELRPIWLEDMDHIIERIKELMGISVDSIIPSQRMGPPNGMLFHLDMGYSDLSEDKLLTHKTKLILKFKNELLPPTSGSTSVGYENGRTYHNFLRR